MSGPSSGIPAAALRHGSRHLGSVRSAGVARAALAASVVFGLADRISVLVNGGLFVDGIIAGPGLSHRVEEVSEQEVERGRTRAVLAQGQRAGRALCLRHFQQ